MENKETKTDIKEDKTTEIDWEEFDEQRRHLVIFGRDVSEIPCFRNSFLYGIGTGLGIGLGAFMYTSRPKLSVHVGYGSFFLTTVSYWFYCRYNYSKTKFMYAQLKTAMKEQALFEGTAVEKEMNAKAESA